MLICFLLGNGYDQVSFKYKSLSGPAMYSIFVVDKPYITASNYFVKYKFYIYLTTINFKYYAIKNALSKSVPSKQATVAFPGLNYDITHFASFFRV